jgi:predicted RNase H-like HicB family nuclease
MNRLGYPIVIAPLAENDGGGFVAYAPDLRGCMSDGETPEEAARNIEDAIVEWLEEAKDAGLVIPEPFSRSRAQAEVWRKVCNFIDRQGDFIESLETELNELKDLMERLLESYEDCSPSTSVTAVAYSPPPRLVAH